MVGFSSFLLKRMPVTLNTCRLDQQILRGIDSTTLTAWVERRDGLDFLEAQSIYPCSLALHSRACRGQECAGMRIVLAGSPCIFCNLIISKEMAPSARIPPYPPDPPHSRVHVTPTMWNLRAQRVCFPARRWHNTDTHLKPRHEILATSGNLS